MLLAISMTSRVEDGQEEVLHGTFGFLEVFGGDAAGLHLVELFQDLFLGPLRVRGLHAALDSEDAFGGGQPGGTVVTEALLFPDVHEETGVGPAAEEVREGPHGRVVFKGFVHAAAEAHDELALRNILLLFAAFHGLREGDDDGLAPDDVPVFDFVEVLPEESRDGLDL